MDIKTEVEDKIDAPTKDMKWYILQVYSGFENVVVAELRHKLETKLLSKLVGNIVIPIKEVIKVKKGKKIKVKKNFLPGYVLINMILTEELLTLIRCVPKVSGFLGAKKGETIPKEVSVDEVNNILQNIEETVDKNNIIDNQFVVGQYVVIAEGPFASFSGVIEDVDKEKQKLKLSVSIFDRLVPVELNFTQVEKDNNCIK